jgi:carbamoyl-phosphate synthase large subunit
LVEVCRREAVGLVFPVLDPDIPVLAANRAALEATGAKLAVVPAEASAVARDKWATTQFFRRVGVPTPQAWLPEEFDAARATYPVFMKPRAGSAAKDAYKVRDGEEFRFLLPRVPDAIVQEFLPGPEITNDVVCDLSGQLLAVVSRKRLEVRNGEVTKAVTVYSAEIHDACARVAAALPAVGPITVQCMLKDEKPYFTEINARLGGGVPLAIAAGVDVPALLLARAAGRPVDLPGPGAYAQGLYLIRFDDSFVLTEAQREQMARRHL